MEISILKRINYKSSAGLVNNEETFDPMINRSFNKGLRMNNGAAVSELTKDILPLTYSSADESTYIVGDVVYKDGVLQLVVDTEGGIAAKQISAYSAPNTFRFGLWDNRYMKIGTMAGGVTTLNIWADEPLVDMKLVCYSLIYNSGEDAYYWGTKIQYNTTTYQTPDYSTGVIYAKYKEGEKLKLKWLNGEYESHEIFNSPPVPNVTIAWSSDTVNADGRYEGTKAIIGDFKENIDGWECYEMGFQNEDVEFVTYGSYPQVETNISLDRVEGKAECLQSADCETRWNPTHLIKDGHDFYARTNTNDPYLTEDVAGVVFLPLTDLTPSWGWSAVGPTVTYAPLDGKSYNSATSIGGFEYTVSSDDPFDTVGLNKLISDDVEITFLPRDGSDEIPMIPTVTDCSADADNRLPKLPITIIAYAPRDIVGSVHVKVNSTGPSALGEIVLGQTVNAGFTNLVFSNKFKDYSPYEKDQWGNILYVEGVKTNIYMGTVDIEVEFYDRVNRLISELGATTVLLNGSDNSGNTEDGRIDFFSSTQVLGRIRNFVLKTKLDNRELHQMATYNFEIEENV